MGGGVLKLFLKKGIVIIGVQTPCSLYCILPPSANPLPFLSPSVCSCSLLLSTYLSLSLSLDAIPLSLSASSVCLSCRASGDVNNDIVVEMKTEKANEEAGLLNKPAAQQVRRQGSLAGR